MCRWGAHLRNSREQKFECSSGLGSDLRVYRASCQRPRARARGPAKAPAGAPAWAQGPAWAPRPAWTPGPVWAPQAGVGSGAGVDSGRGSPLAGELLSDCSWWRRRGCWRLNHSASPLGGTPEPSASEIELAALAWSQPSGPPSRRLCHHCLEP